MKKSQFTEEQITYVLRQVEAGTLVADVCRKLGVSEQTFYRWKETTKKSGQRPQASDDFIVGNAYWTVLGVSLTHQANADGPFVLIAWR